jgi:hypothetical protein
VVNFTNAPSEKSLHVLKTALKAMEDLEGNSEKLTLDFQETIRHAKL